MILAYASLQVHTYVCVIQIGNLSQSVFTHLDLFSEFVMAELHSLR